MNKPKDISPLDRRPPRWANPLLEWFCAAHLLEEVQGDLQEMYGKWVERHGVQKARWLYILHALKFFRPYSIKRISINNPTIMLRNYFIIALRNLLKQKLYSFINIFGLAVGLACFILILLFVQYELSYDRFYENSDQIYRMVKRDPGDFFHGMDGYAVTPAPLAGILVDEFPEVTSATTTQEQKALLSINEQNFWEKGFWVDPHFFDVFNMPLLEGNPETALSEPNSIVLTKSLAHKIFDDKDPVGETLLYQKKDLYKVTGVMPDVPPNSTLQFTYIMSIVSQAEYVENLADYGWNRSNYYTFFKLNSDADDARLQAKIPALVKKYPGKENGPTEQYFIQPLTDIHLGARFNFDLEGQGNIKYVYLFSAIAILILILACVNYMNLAVARSIKRGHEVGLRKVVGAVRRQLIFQFLGESVLMAFLALVLALVLVQLLFPAFGHLMERPIEMDFLNNGWLLPGLMILMVLVGLLSGSYPAFFLASLRPVQVLKGVVEGKPGRFRMQRLLIVGQYAISIALIASSFIIYRQFQYIQHKDMGYDREQVVTVRVNDEAVQQNYEVIRNEWLENPNIISVAASQHLPTYIASNNGITGWEGSSQEDHLDFYITYGDYDYIEVFGIQLVAGRNFSRDFATDTLGAALINESAAKAFGWTPEEAIGKHFIHNRGERTIVGVVKDFHTQSLHLPIEPLVIRLAPGWMGYISAKVTANDLPGTIAFLEKTIKQVSSYPFEYQFLDENFDQLYKEELRLGETFGSFTILALIIASLGLFGLAAFTAEQRTKEIGIRKVLGASVQSIVQLLTKDFLRLVALAFILATPIAWYAMQLWLQDFAYRINIEWWMFAFVGVIAFLIALLTVCYQSIKAALMNPVDSLRNE